MISRIGEIFTRLAGAKSGGTINQSKFAQLATWAEGSKGAMHKSEYAIIYTQVTKKYHESAMDLSLFIDALETVADRLTKEKSSTCAKLLKLVNRIEGAIRAKI